jgi:NAD-dependent SIR2 family protein deacetylase
MNNPPEQLSVAALYALESAKQRLAGKRIGVLTGAGISTDSGIPDYRGAGRIARHPMTFDAFMGSAESRQRYWARSFVGWSKIELAKPNAAHFALAAAEKAGHIEQIVTQNVDGLHQKAGSNLVVDLHGRLDRVKCMSCDWVISRSEMDTALAELNPSVNRDVSFEFTPDGDAEVETSADFKVPKCQKCQGLLKPDVVFFGESVPTQIVEFAMGAVLRSEALLVAGTSLQVNSGLRFARRAHRAGIDVVIVNLGPTKADDLAIAKIEANTSLVLGALLDV